MNTIGAALQAEIDLVQRLAGQAGRPVELLAVSKGQPVAAIESAYRAGQRKFAESYVQEALVKMAATATLDIEWHFIGPIQSNKARVVAEHFSWVHALDRIKIAERLDAARPPHLGPLDVCVQVNISAEDTKHGVQPAAAAGFCRAVADLPRLRLRGLMAIGRPGLDFAAQRVQFRALRELFDDINDKGQLAMDTLSMGMSQDLEAAIREGATIVRIGTAIFGARAARHK